MSKGEHSGPAGQSALEQRLCEAGDVYKGAHGSMGRVVVAAVEGRIGVHPYKDGYINMVRSTFWNILQHPKAMNL